LIFDHFETLAFGKLRLWKEWVSISTYQLSVDP
jgi:hypothetical protein